MELTPIDGGDDLACIQSQVTNGKSMTVAGVSYVAAGIAGAALLMTGVSAMASAGSAAGAGAISPSPSFGEVMGWFQGMAMNGMMSVKYPSVYTSFSKNFGFSTGLIPWSDMQNTIDNFRQSTGGNLTHASYAYLRNATIVHTSASNVTKRGLDTAALYIRDSLTTNVNGTESSTSDGDDDDDSSSKSQVMEYVNGIKGYVEELSIPQANTFMTILLVFAIVIGAIAVGILLLKVILETWALFGSFPAKLTNFRKRYWWILAKTITNLILLLYGIWVLYCIYQFSNGDSWAAKVLAGVTLGLFTAVLGFFAYRIWSMAQKFKKAEGDVSGLFEDKETWRKYSLFYENYKKGYWWLFVPVIVYSFAKGCVIAGLDGHGLAQTGAQLVIEALMLCLLLWSRPYTLKSSNVINCTIQVVRVLSVVCVLVFVEELGISQTTKTVTGVVLIVMQSVLTGVLAILIAVNSIVVCCKENPHRKKRKEQGKLICAAFAQSEALTFDFRKTQPRSRQPDSSGRSQLAAHGPGRVQEPAPLDHVGGQGLRPGADARGRVEEVPRAQHVAREPARFGGRHGPERQGQVHVARRQGTAVAGHRDRQRWLQRGSVLNLISYLRVQHLTADLYRGKFFFPLV